MVNYDIIEDIITDLFNNNTYFEFKCLSKKQIIAKLNAMSEEDKLDALGDLYVEGIISDYEAQYYEEWGHKWDKVKNKDFNKFPEHVRKELEALGECIYNIESKIFTKKPNELSKFKEDDFKGDDMPYNSDDNGKIEQLNVDAQNKKLSKINWDTYGDGANFYGDKYYDMNKSLVMGVENYFKSLVEDGSISNKYLDEYIDATKKCINHMNYLMDNSGGLAENTILYRGGQFPPNLLPGMKGKFETFSSTSYNREKAEGFQQEGKEYLMTIYAPKGTRGLSGNASPNGDISNKTIGSHKEHEFTLGHGQNYIVLDRNDKTMEVSILLI